MLEILMSFRLVLTAACAASALCLGGSPALAASPNHQSCFLSSDWNGWKSPDPKTIYLRVGVNRIFRLDLANPSYSLSDPSVHLVSEVRGSSWICSPLDLQLKVSDTQGVLREPLFVKNITELTPAEAKAIPAKYRP
jgi:hypothetical protein